MKILCAIILFFIITIFIHYNKFENYENKKKCLIIFYGLPRTVLKTYENFYKTIIHPNKDKYDFTIIINTSNNGDFDVNKLNELYNCKNIIIENYEDDTYIVKDKFHYHLYRLYAPLKEEVNNHYDMYIYSRMDIEINKDIYLDDYIDSLCITEANFIIEHGRAKESFHNRDHTHLWIGSEIPFKIWCYHILKYNFNLLINDDFIYKDRLQINTNYKLDANRILEIKKHVKLDDENNPYETNDYLFYILNEILLYNYDVTLGSEKGIYNKIVR